jgi:hypothetical protein
MHRCVIPLQVVGGALKGGVAVAGSRIVDGDINISLQKYNKGQSYTTHLTNSSSWILSQVENAARFLSISISELSELQFSMDDNQNRTDMSFLKNALDRVLTNLSRAKNEMMLHPSGLFPNSQTYLSKCFHPELPADIALEFHIFKGKLIASVYALSTVNHSVTPSPDSFIGHNVRYQGAMVQVIDFWEGEYTVVNFQEAVSTMDEVIALCTNLRDKTAAILSLHH